MYSAISDKQRNLVAIGMLILSIISLAISLRMGYAQDKLYLKQYETYLTAVRDMEQAKYDSAQVLFKGLLDEDSSNWLLMWQYAQTLSRSGNYPEACKYFAKAQSQRPALVTYQNFLLEYGRALYQNGNYSDALTYLTQGKGIAPETQLAKEIQPILDKLDSISVLRGQANGSK